MIFRKKDYTVILKRSKIYDMDTYVSLKIQKADHITSTMKIFFLKDYINLFSHYRKNIIRSFFKISNLDFNNRIQILKFRRKKLKGINYELEDDIDSITLAFSSRNIKVEIIFSGAYPNAKEFKLLVNEISFEIRKAEAFFRGESLSIFDVIIHTLKKSCSIV